MSKARIFPQRIVALSAESADILQQIGAWNRVVGVTGFYQLPAGLKPKPRIGGFSHAHIDKILALRPDLVITYSDVQADLARQLLSDGIQVLATNQRTLEEIQNTILLIGRILNRENAALKLIQQWQKELSPVRRRKNPPLVYFEEWNDPLITGIGWVSELIERAGGRDAFPEKRGIPRAMDRAISPEEVARRNPDIIIASWCGKKVNREQIIQRPGWSEIKAVRNRKIFEIKSPDILQPGPRLTLGYQQLKTIIAGET